MTIRDIAIAVGFEVDQQSRNNVENSISNLKGMAQKLLGTIGIGLSIAGITNLVETAAEVEALGSQFSQVFGSAEKEASASLERIANDTGVAEGRIKSSFVQIGAFAKTTGLDENEALNIADRAMVAVADSAAFYDKSIEQVTANMQSFLKGNYQIDAALGLSCTQYTRDAAAAKLYGTEFNKLSEAQKQLTLLQMVEDANKLSGAEGQAARETDQWTNQIGNLHQRIKDLKVAVGRGFLAPAIQVVKFFQNVLGKITSGVEEITKEGGFLEREWARIKEVFKLFQPIVDKVMTTFNKGAETAKEATEKLIERFGGIDNILHIVTATVLAVTSLFAFNRAKNGVMSMIKLLSKLRLPMMPMVAILTVIILLVYDLMSFMSGKESVLGKCFEKAGLDADEYRAKIQNIFDNLGKFFGGVWETMKQVMAPVLELVRTLLEKAFGTDIFEGAGTGIGAVVNVLERLTKLLANSKVTEFVGVIAGAAAIVGVLVPVITTVINVIGTLAKIVGVVIKVFKAAKAAFIAVKAVLAALGGPITIAIAIIAGLIAIGVLLYKNWDTVKEKAAQLKEAVVGKFEQLKERAAQAIENLKQAVSDKIQGVRTAIVDGINAAVEFIKSLPGEAYQWGADLISNLIEGIKDHITGVAGAIGEVAGKITSYIHFTEPDEGPLRNFHEWMPDFVNGLANDLRTNQGPLIRQAKSMAESLSSLTKAAVVSANTIGTSSVSNRTTSVTQNVNISNKFNGVSREIQATTAKAARKSATDATTQMARGLAYARG